MTLFSFARDGVVSTGEPPGPVPLDFVRALEKRHDVWVHGNQKLCSEAVIPGMQAVGYELGLKSVQNEPKLQRILLVQQASQSKDRRIVVDITPLYGLEEQGWEYYTPKEFVEKFLHTDDPVDKPPHSVL